MNFVVLTSALSSLNAGLYSTGRIVRSMAMNGSAPKFAAKLNKGGVPFGGIAITGVVAVLGVVLNYLAPGRAFEIVLNASALGIIASWGTIVLCQMRLHAWSKKGIVERPHYRLFGAPFTGYLVLAFLVAVLGIMAYDPDSRPTVLALVVIVRCWCSAGSPSASGSWPPPRSAWATPASFPSRRTAARATRPVPVPGPQSGRTSSPPSP